MKEAKYSDGSHVAYDPKYEWKAVALLSLGFGLVSVDRFMIMPLFPAIAQELGLGYADLGLITGALAIAWGAAAMVMGNLSDRLGHRKVIVGAIVMFSLLVGVSGLAASLSALVAMRVLMGLADGAYTPVSISATIAASKPSRHGFNLGVQQMMSPLLGLAIAPLLVTQLLHFINWRWVFLLLAVPGLVLAIIMARVLREYDRYDAPSARPAIRDNRAVFWSNWVAVLKMRNPPILIGCMLCWLTSLAVNAALMPSYLLSDRHLSLSQMGMILSAFGFGGVIGSVALPALSDHVGRKPMMLLSAITACVSLLALLHWAKAPAEMFGCLFVMAVCSSSCLTLTVGPMATESVPATLMATSAGMIIGFGEILGGGIAPILAGLCADRYGLAIALHAGPAAFGMGTCLVLFLRETLPRRNHAKVGIL